MDTSAHTFLPSPLLDGPQAEAGATLPSLDTDSKTRMRPGT